MIQKFFIIKHYDMVNSSVGDCVETRDPGCTFSSSVTLRDRRVIILFGKDVHGENNVVKYHYFLNNAIDVAAVQQSLGKVTINLF